MPLGFDREQNIVNLTDSADIHAYLYDKEDELIPESDLMSVSFTIQKPDGTKTTLTGEVSADGEGYVRFEDTDQVGQYIATAQFTLIDGAKKSSRADFEVIDPFEEADPSNVEIIADAVWSKFEDCFDAEEEGPWLRDMTLNRFNPSKISQFISEGLMDINLQHPPTDVGVGDFMAVDADGLRPALPILTGATFLAVIRHLMRSYVEQPEPRGANVVYEDRRDYLERWGQVYQVEMQWFTRAIALWKRQFLGLGRSSMLVGSKAGRLIPAPMRTRNIGRGYF